MQGDWHERLHHFDYLDYGFGPRLRGRDKGADKKEREKLVGTWIGTKYQLSGIWDPDEAKKYVYLITVERIIVKYKGEETCQTSYTLDLKNPPNKIDMIILAEPMKGRVLYGIYSIEEDTLTICGNHRGQKIRPTEFKTKPGDGQSLIILKREKK
jgi:uncharacterized protein (TIGR03067 family)